MVAAECAPTAKAGGLGDVVSGLSRELEIRGHAVEIILPKYDSLRSSDIWDLAPSYHDLQVPWYGGTVHCTVWFGYTHGRKCFFIEPHSAADFFGRDRLYGYWDDAERFAFFSKAAIEFMVRSGKRPDIVHLARRSATPSTTSAIRAPATSGCCGPRNSAGPTISSTRTGWAMTSGTGA
jgi:starch synthase